MVLGWCGNSNYCTASWYIMLYYFTRWKALATSVPVRCQGLCIPIAAPPTTLDMAVGRIILDFKKFFYLNCLSLEGHDELNLKDHTCNCIWCHLLNIDSTIDISISYISARLRYMLCGRFQFTTSIVVYDVGLRRWHMKCLNPPFKAIIYDCWLWLWCI